jgi:hypothetical protein
MKKFKNIKAPCSTVLFLAQNKSKQNNNKTAAVSYLHVYAKNPLL